jgi:hypothetical protein
MSREMQLALQCSDSGCTLAKLSLQISRELLVAAKRGGEMMLVGRVQHRTFIQLKKIEK